MAIAKKEMKEKPHTSRSAKPRKRLRCGFTLTELMVTMLIALIVVLAVGTVIADGVRGWQKTYEQVYTGVRDNSFIARKTFDRVIRNATRHMYSIADDGSWVEVYYHSVSSAPIVDRYARFKVNRRALILERGTFTPGDAGSKSPLTYQKICPNVESCIFKADTLNSGRSIQMILSLDNGAQDLVVVTSAVMHNGS